MTGIFSEWNNKKKKNTIDYLNIIYIFINTYLYFQLR